LRERGKRGTIALGAIALILIFMIIVSCVAVVVMEYGRFAYSAKASNETVAARAKESLNVQVSASNGTITVTNVGSTPSLVIGVYAVNPEDKNLRYYPLDTPVGVGTLGENTFPPPKPLPKDWRVGVLTSLGNVFWETPIAEAAPGQTAWVTFYAKRLGGDVSGVTVLTVDGAHYGHDDLPQSFAWLVGSLHSFEWNTPIPSTAPGKRYVTSAGAGTITVPPGGDVVTAEYKAQYEVTLQTSGLGSDFNGDSVTLDGVDYRVYDGHSVGVWIDAGSTISYLWSSPISSTTSGKRYVVTSAQSGSITVNRPKTLTGSYKTQYRLTMRVNPDGAGATNPSVGDHWHDSGTTITISAYPASGYRFEGWSGSGPGSYTGTSNPATITMNGPITETANFAKGPLVLFYDTFDSDLSGWTRWGGGSLYWYRYDGDPAPCARVYSSRSRRGWAGMQKVVDLSPAGAYHSLTLSFDFKAYAYRRGSRYGANIYLMVYDADTGTQLLYKRVYYGYSTGWRHHTMDIASHVRGHSRIRIVLGLYDSSRSRSYRDYFDNVRLEASL
jgi:hypothetical protein